MASPKPEPSCPSADADAGVGHRDRPDLAALLQEVGDTPPPRHQEESRIRHVRSTIGVRRGVRVGPRSRGREGSRHDDGVEEVVGGQAAQRIVRTGQRTGRDAADPSLTAKPASLCAAMPDQIIVRGLRKQFPKVLAVAGVDLTVARGEVFGLLGPNGAGKTTTLEMIEGLTQPDAGEISIGGLNWKQNAHEIRSRIGVQLQATSLYNKITPREALDLFGGYYPKRRGTDELLRLVQLEDKAGACHVTLSGGQAQRLALALALVNDPQVVFLDEPTAGLDPQGRRSLWEIVRAMRDEGRTVVLTTHYMDEAEALCDRLAILDHGTILRSGTPPELIASLGIPSVVELTFPGVAPDSGAFASRLGSPVEARGDIWEIPTTDPKTSLPRILSAIESEQVDYQQVHVRRATLEDVFLQLTGRSLRD